MRGHSWTFITKPCLFIKNIEKWTTTTGWAPDPVFNGVITPISGVITLLTTSRDPPCRKHLGAKRFLETFVIWWWWWWWQLCLYLFIQLWVIEYWKCSQDDWSSKPFFIAAKCWTVSPRSVELKYYASVALSLKKQVLTCHTSRSGPCFFVYLPRSPYIKFTGCVNIGAITLRETNSSPLKIGRGPKRKRSYSNHPFSGTRMLVSGRVLWYPGKKLLLLDKIIPIVATLLMCRKGDHFPVLEGKGGLSLTHYNIIFNFLSGQFIINP